MASGTLRAGQLVAFMDAYDVLFLCSAAEVQADFDRLVSTEGRRQFELQDGKPGVPTHPIIIGACAVAPAGQGMSVFAREGGRVSEVDGG